MKSPKKKKKRTKQDGGMSLWSRLRFAIDFDDDDESPTTGGTFNDKVKEAIQTIIQKYKVSTSTNPNDFQNWYNSMPDTSTFSTNFLQVVRRFSPKNRLAVAVIKELIPLVPALNIISITPQAIRLLLEPLLVDSDIADALFPAGGSKQPITAMESVLIAQLCHDKLKNAINGAAGLGITVADGHGKKPTTRKSRGRKSRSPSRR